MTRPARLAHPLVVASLLGCEAQRPAEPASTPAPTISAAKAAESAHGGPLLPMDAEPPPPGRTATGSIEAEIDGTAVVFPLLSYGRNVLVDVPDRGIARVWVSGARADTGFPAVRLLLEHVRLDGLELPVELPGPAGAKSPAEIEIRYETDERRSWHSRTDAPERERARVRIESFDGTTVRGTFSATLQPKSKAFGPPVRIENGRFAATLRRSGGTD